MLLPRKFGGRLDRRPALIPAFYLASDSATIQLLAQLDGDVATTTGKVEKTQGAIEGMTMSPSCDRGGQRFGSLTEVIDSAKTFQRLVMQLGRNLGIVHPFRT
jgi:hypothetical protein